jgi:hypothetical protein
MKPIFTEKIKNLESYENLSSGIDLLPALESPRKNDSLI